MIDGLAVGKGETSLEELDAVTKKRIERTLIRTVGSTPLPPHTHTHKFAMILVHYFHKDVSLMYLIRAFIYPQEGGSYQQRVLVEYLKGIQSRAEDIAQVLQGKTR